MEGSLALDGIATSAPYIYSALDPKSMEERGVEQFRRKPKFQYVRFMIVPSTNTGFGKQPLTRKRPIGPLSRVNMALSNTR